MSTSSPHCSSLAENAYDDVRPSHCELAPRRNQISPRLALTADTRCVHSRASQLLFEAPVLLPLTPKQRRVIEQLDFFKRWYLLCHFLYICVWVGVGVAGLCVLVPHLPFVDALFLAISSVCNCGLLTVDVGEWSTQASLFRHLLLIPSGVVMTSSFQPLLRLFMLYRVRQLFCFDEKDTPQDARLRAAKREEAHRLYFTALVSAITPLVYFFVINGIVMILLWRFNAAHLSGFEVFCMTLASFHSSIFLPMKAYANDVAVTGLVTVACALGFTAYPVVLPLFMHLEWFVVRAVRRLVGLSYRYAAYQPASDESAVGVLQEEDENDMDDDDAATSLLHTTAHSRPRLLLAFVGDIDGAFREILTSRDPGTFHPFLFRPSEALFLAGAWCALTLMQAVPFWYEQWDGVLRGFSAPYKIYLSLCQAAVVRFAAASFVPLNEYSNAHVAVTILAMYLPALPISTDRTYRKWRQMFRTSMVRLLTSRLFWLFIGMVAVLFAEESVMRELLTGTRFDIMTRTFFEVISAYSGCGLSLTVGSSSVSFVGRASTFSKLVIAAIILGGRHRFVDLGIDLGFGNLQAQVDVGGSTAGAPVNT